MVATFYGVYCAISERLRRGADRQRRAVDDGQLPADTDAPTMAAAFNTMLDGMSLRARDGASRSELEQVGVIAMSMFHSANPTPSHPSGVQP